jgi:hypothetical protein
MPDYHVCYNAEKGWMGHVHRSRATAEKCVKRSPGWEAISWDEFKRLKDEEKKRAATGI